MKISYYLIDPTGNITILVKTPVAAQDQPALALSLMALEPAAEQVGFLSEDPVCDVGLRMAGGEFCGNASMSSAVVRAFETGLTSGRVKVRASGAAAPVMAQVALGEDGVWTGSVDMPGPREIRTCHLEGAGERPVVFFDGIAHVIMEGRLPGRKAETLAPLWCRALKTDALGIMFVNDAFDRMTPLVYVPAADTLFWENSCASGTSAAGACLASRAGGPVERSIRQPGGTLRVFVSEEGAIHLTGSVRILKKTETEL